ncbi:FtsX-like permease family protein [Krasilnikoviella flava]|uniref:Putative ABC transport system permease protein n=1 Tax=Krasilnikoviella flava TaxID=526729 RepID=A0A1T5KZ27_9MICO|nr:FtsX-like permease family protein [Krasilnikoviella flava]SKC69027.1 putative ABC transport system permease protein [Krasilnikoviella flava]
MLALAARTFAHHRVSAVATGAVAMVGTALVTAMAGMLSTGLAATTSADDRSFLTQFPLILGGWIVVIVVFAMVSTVGVALEGRAGEIAGIRLIGATPRQVQWLSVLETAVVSVVAAVPGIAGGYVLGWVLHRTIRAAGLTAGAPAFAPGAALPLVGALVVLVASVAAAWLGSRTVAARSPVADAAPALDRRTGRRAGRRRRVAAAVLTAAGLALSAAVLGMDPDDLATTAMTGPGCVLVAAGLSTLAPELLSLANRALRVLPGARRTASSHLAAINLAAAPERVRPTVTFLTLFVGVAAGTLGMQGIENAAGSSGGTGELVGVINYVVVTLIAVFMAIALTNNLVATIVRRRPEFATMALIGATGAQARRMVVAEITVAALVSAVAGCLGALASTLPFAIVKSGGALAALAPAPYVLAVGVGGAITLAVTLLAGRHAIRSA